MTTKLRNTNFELLRVLAMLFIVMHHIICHTAAVQLIQTNNTFQNPIFYNRLFLFDIGYFWGPLANTLFVLISGYFLVGNKSININKTAKKLLSQLFFAAVTLVAVSSLLYKCFGFCKKLYGIDIFNEMSWYVGFYFVVILCGKLFLNKMICNFSYKQYAEFLLIIFALIQFSWTRSLIDGVVEDLSTLFVGVFLYSFGGFIRKYNVLARIKTIVLLFYSLLVVGSIYISSYNIRIMDINLYLMDKNKAYVPKIVSFSMTQILVILTGIIVFELFRRLKIKHNEIINYLGASTFMVYLIHDNELFYHFWNRINWVEILHKNVFVFIVVWVGVAMLTFAIGVIAYILFNVVCTLTLKLKTICVVDAVDNKGDSLGDNI